MLATILGLLSSLLGAIGKIATIWQAQQQKQAGADEILARDAKAEADAARQSEAVATGGQTNAQTQADLTAGDF
jgi:hypothetical protein